MNALLPGWNHVAQFYWLHHQVAVIRLRWQRVGPLRSCVIGQGSDAHGAAKFGLEEYCGPRLEFRYNDATWAYALNYPGVPSSIEDLAADARACGVPIERENVAELRRDMAVLHRWALKSRYVVEDGVWREV